jgi:hypothetical protein
MRSDFSASTFPRKPTKPFLNSSRDPIRDPSIVVESVWCIGYRSDEPEGGGHYVLVHDCVTIKFRSRTRIPHECLGFKETLLNKRLAVGQGDGVGHIPFVSHIPYNLPEAHACPCRNDVLAIERKCDGVEHFLAAEDMPLRSCCGIPYSYVLVRGRSDGVTIGRECNGMDDTFMAYHGVLLRARRDVPHPYRTIVKAGDDKLASRRKRNGGDLAFMVAYDF